LHNNLCLWFASAYFGLGFTKTSDKKPSVTLTPTPISYSQVSPAPITNPKGVFNLLFLGYGGRAMMALF